MENARTINLDGISYDVGQFSQGVQQAVTIYNKFLGDLQSEQLAVAKTQAALQTLQVQISEAVRKELAEKQAAASAPAANGQDGEAHTTQ